MDMSTTVMQTYFTTSYANTPLLFRDLTPSTPAALFAVWIIIFFISVLYRGLAFLKTYLEATYWSPQTTTTSDDSSSNSGDFILKQQKPRYVQPFSLQRDGGRALLAFVTATVGYALMLVVMSFVVVSAFLFIFFGTV